MFVHPTRAIAGEPVILVATVKPRMASGTVQFKDGSTNVGAPQTARFGFAALVTEFPVGTHELTAGFTPDNPAAYQPSTSNAVRLTVRDSNS